MTWHTGLLNRPGEYWLWFECNSEGVFIDITEDKLLDKRWMDNFQLRLRELKCKGWREVIPPPTPRRD